MRPANATGKTVRAHLRERTRDAHDRLDAIISCLDLGERSSYAQFLQIQFCARAPIERWLASCDMAIPLPPPMCAVIEDDLNLLGHTAPVVRTPFVMPASAAPLGVVWALGGSALGNAVLGKQVPEGSPCNFLAAPEGAAYWRILRPWIEAPMPRHMAEPLAEAAAAVFTHFEANCRNRLLETI